MKNYIEILDTEYQSSKHTECAPDSKVEFLGQSVFGFTTDDGEIDLLFSQKMIDVINVILNNTNYQYIKSRKNYLNYLTMVNMPFLQDKLDYGTSIRGAWFDDYSEYTISSCNIQIPKMELTEFIRQLLVWIKI